MGGPREAGSRLRALSGAGVLALLCLSFSFAAPAADVVTDGNMELAGTTNWPLTNVTGTNTSAKATDQKGGGAQSLKGVSQTGSKLAREWYVTQSVGTIAAGSTVNLSFWYGYQHFVNVGGGATTELIVESKAAGAGTWTQLWTSGVLAGNMTFQSATVAATNVSASFATTDTYQIRLRVTGQTGNNAGAYFSAWWDNVVLDVAAGCSHQTPTVTVSAPTSQTGCRNGSVTFNFTVKSNCTGNCGTETFNLAYGNSAAGFTNSGGPATVGLTAGATSGSLSVTVNIGAAATGPDTLTITASLAGHTNHSATATTTVDTTAPSAPTAPTCTGSSSSQIDLSWTNPGADFAGALVVRGPAGGAAPTFVPAAGTTYPVGAQGSDYIVAVGAVSAASDTGLTASTTYAYRIYAYDTCRNYSTALATSCATLAGGCTHAAPTVTVQAPTSQTGCRNGSVTYTFTVKSNCTGSCGTETFTLGYSNSGAGFTNSGGPATVGLTAGATSGSLTVQINIGAAATGPDTLTITASLAGHTNGAATATTTVDTTAPSAPTAPTCTGASASQINLSWTNPGADFAGALVVRGPAGGAAPTFAPVAGTTYSVGAQGSDYIVAVGAVSAASDTGLASSTTYAYRIYAYDICKRYSSALATSCATLAGSTTTVGNGTNPGGANLCPGGAATMLDAFTLQTSAGTDVVTAVTVTFATGTAGGVGLVEITNSAGGTVYGSFTNPAGVQTVTLGTTITATTTLTTYMVRITPRSHAAMPAVPGATYAVTGTVTGLTSTNGKSYNDTASATVTIDNASPASATWGTVTPGDTQVVLNWANPADADFNQVVILRSAGATADVPVEGTTYAQGNTIGTSTVRYVGALATFTDTGLTNGTAYYYKLFAKDTCGNYSPGVLTGPYTPTAATPVATTAGTASATVSGCRQIDVTAPFTGDGDNDGSVKVEYNTTNTWPGTTACAAVSGPSPRMCSITGLLPSTPYYVRVTYTDPDGIAGGTAVQVLAGTYTTTACGADQDPPVLTVLTPTRNAVVSGADTFKVQVFDAGGLAATTPVRWAVDSPTASNTAVSVNANYSCGATCWVYEIAVPAQTAGSHYLTITATDAANNVGRISWPFVSKVAKTGSGDLLRRTHSSELCLDCHALQTHSAQHTSTKYGNWSIDCQTCHTAHKTKNIYLVREQIQTPNSGVKSPVFYKDDRAGGTNPANSYLGPSTLTYDDGICEVCHTKTNHYRNDTSGGDHTHNQGARCVDCHKHTEGFKGAGCNGCHGGPPTTGRHAKHWEVSAVPVVPSSYTDTASQSTAALYGIACAKCHTGTHINATNAGTLADPYQVQVAFDTTATPTNPGGTYTGGTAQTPDQGPNSEYWAWKTGTCGTLYCHSNAAPVGGTNSYKAPVWDGASTLGCSGCHSTVARSDNANTLTDLSNAHGKHIRSTSGETATYTIKCDECHALVIRDNPNDPWLLVDADLGDKTRHVAGNHSVNFSPTSSVNAFDQSAGTYAQGPNYTCSNTYCHSNGQDRAAPFTSGPSIAWNATAAADCSSCHGGNATAATKMGPSNDHAAHMDQATYLGTNVACGRCHSATVNQSNDRAVTTLTNHVNGLADVSMVNVDATAAGTYSGSATKTCTNVYCHSDGTETLGYINTNLDWDAGFAKANDCKACHGTEAGSVAGEPRYTNNTASNDTRNSHAAHVFAAADCVDCHSGTVTAAGALITAGTQHLDKAVQVAGAKITSYTDATETCNTVTCHGGGSPQWGATLTCRDCHMPAAAAGDQEVDDYTYDNGTLAKIDRDDWYAYGHGATAAFTESGNTAANFDNGNPGTRNGCLYCHTTGVAHNVAANPFRLANVGAASTVALKNGVCTVCHGGTGYDPDGGGAMASIDAPDNIDAWHYGVDHAAAGGDGGMFCWDCHDPHGDYNYASTQRLAYMIEETPTEDHAGSTGWGVPTTLATTPDFRNNRDGTAGWAYQDYVSNTLVGGSYRGICQVCHDNTAHFRKATLYDGTTHYNTGNPRCSASCHTHDQPPSDAFKPQGGDCLGCHGTSTQGTRRAVTADFQKESHHVGESATAYLRGTLTANDCVVCHAEGDATAQGATPTTGSLHQNGVIDLRNADSATASFAYDKDAVATSAGAAANWHSGNATWRTQTSTALDPFCLSCHDSDGATQTYLKGETGALVKNPFKDNVNGAAVSNNLTNSYDQMTRPGVIDIKSKVTGAPPAQGSFARHAIRGQSTSKYTNYTTAAAWPSNPNGYSTIYSANRFTSMGTDENGKPNWNDSSMMGCADCHTTDGANTTTGNAHGSTSEYLLKDASGGAAEGSFAGGNENCARCHVNYGTAHTAGNGSDFQDTVTSTGGARITAAAKGYGTMFGLACINCHGGAQGNGTGTGDSNGFGWIHGTSQVFGRGQDGAAGTRNAYRFMNGGGLRYYSPGNTTTWDTGVGTCYTLAGADTWSGCAQHDRGTGATTLKRPLTY